MENWSPLRRVSTIQQVRIGEIWMWTAGCDDVLSGLWLEMGGCPWAHMYQTWDYKGRQQEEQQKELTNKHKKSRHPVTCQYVAKTVSSAVIDQLESWKQRLDETRQAFQVHQLSPNVNPLNTTKRQVLYSTGQWRDCCLRSSYDFPTDSRALFTNQVRTCIKLRSRGCSNIVLPFLHTFRTFPSNCSAHHQTS